jgi:hydroxymethylpyrimidine pyrophosphatase-like HAD family hydrolase/hypoxanthine phosphoribosyltransferase
MILDTQAAEEQFYRHYNWCLNPALSVHDLLLRYQEEIDRYPSLTGWQSEESKANLYLFVCAIACTADDYFAQRWVNFSPLRNRFPRFRTPIGLAQRIVDISRSLAKIQDAAAWRWRRRWDACIANSCRLLLIDSTKDAEAFNDLRESSSDLLRVDLPAGLSKRRMRLPEAFRNQDMAHHDVITLIRQFSESPSTKVSPIAIAGLRTAGAYFAPLMTEYLKSRGWPDVSWFSLRPKNGLSRWEEQQLRRIAREGTQLLVVDDYPATGWTLRLTLEILQRCGIRPDQMAVLAPTHAAQPNWPRVAAIDDRTKIFTIEPAALFKNVWLASNEVASLCGSYFAATEWGNARLLPEDEVDAINRRLAEHSKDGHHVREKRVFTLELSRANVPVCDRAAVRKRVFFKSVGWGWLGYHAYIAGKRLDGFVPRMIGLRHGLLLTDWIEGAADHHRPQANDGVVRVLASYVATRVRRLPITGNCRLDGLTYRWTGIDEILRILRAAYGRYVNRLKMPAIRKEVYKYVTSVPTFIDGNMKPEEWLHTPTGIFKADFEHHNFGGAEPDIVDPAYDLAAAILEFGLSKEAEQELLRTYRALSGDQAIEERLLVHKILYGSREMRYSFQKAAAGKEAAENNARHQAARNFLIYSMNEFCAKLSGFQKCSNWSDALFFLDLDGVFDQDVLGFPHATQSALQSLALLTANGFSIVLNTGRSVAHVRQYCDAYGLAGGVAEFGGVFVDAVNGSEIPLIDPVGAEQLQRCREIVQNIPGVFVDPSYEYSIRAYRYERDGFAGIGSEELKNLLRDHGFSDLTYISRDVDFYIVQKRTGKGTALRFVRGHTGNDSNPVAAIGDSQFDIGMLKAAEFAYAPANCAQAVRELAKTGKCRIVKQRYQNGLLAAVQNLLRHQGARRSAPLFQPASDQLNSLMHDILRAADRRTVFQLLLMLSWWSL